MNDDAYRDFEEESPAREPVSRSGRLPGGVSRSTAAIILLGVVLVTILWLFFGPTGEEPPPDLPTATSVAAATAALPSPMVSPGATVITQSTAPPGGMPGAATTAASAALASGTLLPPGAGANLSAGSFVLIGHTDGYGIRLRFGPGLDTATIRIVPDGETLRVSGGPETVNGERWWRLQDNLGNIGWAADQYLSPTIAPPGWNPPAASPTFEADVDEPGAGAASGTATP